VPGKRAVSKHHFTKPPPKSVFIVIPTYNEAENIEALIAELNLVCRELKNWRIDILVVDDNSPDGTAEIVKKLQHKFAAAHLRAQRVETQSIIHATPGLKTTPDLHATPGPKATPSFPETPGNNPIPRLHLLINKSKKGLGAAYTKAFTHILQNFTPDFIIQMDADFQHNPHDIPRFLAQTVQSPASNPAKTTNPTSAQNHTLSPDHAQCASNTNQTYEFIIGSRYIAGGDYPNWSFKRKLYSWGANLIARFIAGIYNIDDCTSGFRCISAKFLRSLDLTALKSDGYAFQMSLLHAASKKRIPIIQIPILFPNRRKGRSKLGHKDIREFFVNAFRLRFKRYRTAREQSAHTSAASAPTKKNQPANKPPKSAPGSTLQNSGTPAK